MCVLLGSVEPAVPPCSSPVLTSERVESFLTEVLGAPAGGLGLVWHRGGGCGLRNGVGVKGCRVLSGDLSADDNLGKKSQNKIRIERRNIFT